MEYKVTKLDRRHGGQKWFKYFVTHAKLGWDYKERWKAEREFIEWQAWCWKTYGQGTERDWTHHIADTAHWGWDTQKSHLPRLYLKGDEELMLFKLKFS